MKSLAITAALTLSLTGKYERQGTEAAEGVRLWADEAGIQLTLIDDHSSKARSVDAYAGWVDGVDLLLGPYASGLARGRPTGPQRRANPLEPRRFSRRPGTTGNSSLPLPPQPISRASSMRRSTARGRLVVVQEHDRSRTVASGAKTRASERGMDSQTIDASALENEDPDEAALLVAGPFEHDVAVVRGLRDHGQSSALLGAVAAGILAFGQSREAAEDVF